MMDDTNPETSVPKVYDIITDEQVPVTQDWCNNMQKGNGIMCQQRRVAAWLLMLNPLNDSKKISSMQARAHELGMGQS